MPTYDYACERCGPFVARQALALFDRPAPCPACGAESARALSVPALMGGRQQRERAGEPSYGRMRHGSACGCCAARGVP